MFKKLAEFRLVQSRRTVPGPREAIIHPNDNLPGFRRPAATGKRRPRSPALACHWFDRKGRLECHWLVEMDAVPIDDFDEHEHCMTGGVSRSRMRKFFKSQTSGGVRSLFYAKLWGCHHPSECGATPLATIETTKAARMRGTWR
ncbi:hypothetical protein HAP41_0000049575 (plasmid) [Bradyrhizobium barranii subsp. apii]|uniref:Uncharacterized protein n=1 Tax=Bradyrhizobium barranii subsp. apii TaxID=2819348 RepID=A0A8T5VK04_9BRAD|nr:hypothetical protein [Bradyrhizobium barranii]UPT92357.1 hypothetical protein HAP41_0000049575 [Bradyrhizobium barranii subsp. apii]